MVAVSDAELAVLAAEGDQEAFGRLAERYAPLARRLARAALADPHDADDAVQDGLLSAWRHIAQYDPGRPFRPWLMRIVVNAAADLRRRRKVRQTEPLGTTVAGAGPTPDRLTERAELRERLTEALARLPERRRVALMMFDAEGYSHAEIAEVLGVPEGTVRSDVFHARRAMRALMHPHAGDSV